GRPMPQPVAATIPAVLISLSPIRPRQGGMRGPPDGGFVPGIRERQPVPGERRGPPPRGFGGPLGPPHDENEWIVLRLNRDQFQKKFLPEIVSRHFATGSNSTYDVLISESLTGKVVYRSSPNLTAAEFTAPDARLFLLEPDSDRPPAGPPARQN